MTERLVSPEEAGAQLAEKIRAGWAAGVCAEVHGAEPFRAAVRIRPGVSAGAAAGRLGFDVWHEWVEAWRDVDGSLLRDVSGRDVRAEVRPRLAVVHLTYADPAYLATGGRRHDAWTTGDVHDIAYAPRTVLVVENRDSRLWFPPLEDALVVEGGGRAAASLLAGVRWVRRAEIIVYWGDIDSDGFAILDHFRRVMVAPADDGSPGRDVSSILMDAAALSRYESLGVSTDPDGRPIPPSSAHLAGLSADERAADPAVATAGPAQFRRIEQERIPGEDAREAVRDLLRV